MSITLGQDITLVIGGQGFWTFVVVGLVLICSIAVFGLSSHAHRSDDPPAPFKLQKRMGLEALPSGVFILGTILWGLVFGLLLLGLLWTIASAAFFGRAATEDDQTALRFILISLTALTATTGAVVAFPVTLFRTHFNHRQTVATEQGLITDRINKAVEMLGTEKVEKIPGKNAAGDDVMIERSAPNMEVRIGAVHALARLARENLNFHVQIMQILCAYIRENAPAEAAADLHMPDMPATDAPDPRAAWKDWEYGTKNKDGERTGGLIQALADLRSRIKTRTDIQTALQVLGHRTDAQRKREAGWPDPDLDGSFPFDAVFEAPQPYPDPWSAKAHTRWAAELDKITSRYVEIGASFSGYQGYRLDLRDANLQGYDLQFLDLRGARFDVSHLQGADLGGAQMQGASLGGAQMQGAKLWRAQMQGANLLRAQMQGANLLRAQMQGANLRGAQMQGANLLRAQMQGANLRGAQMQGANLRGAQMQGAFLGDAQMQAAKLWDAQMQGANLRGAQMQGANFEDAQMQGAELWRAQMQGANLRRAQMQGAELWRAQMGKSTDLSAANFAGSALRSVDLTTVPIAQDQVNASFGDGTMQAAHLPEGIDRPGHWPPDELEFNLLDEATSPFHIEWRRWQDDPEGYMPPPPGTNATQTD